MTDWTTAMVEERLEAAASVFRTFPHVRAPGFFNAWPDYLHSFADKVSQTPRMCRPLPSPGQISRAEEAALWLQWLDKDDARLVWLRANRTPWKPICWELGISRATANRRWRYAIALIVWRLNGRHVPGKRSMEFVISRAPVSGK
ncbi:DUF6362 family protein [Roseibium sp. RKSG952]|uniref:DUF6362 family protein n=1 Tax=Roseibium sp. RKSG952 TaxID=2529384 RepID=UPI0012BBF42D|nr:DUF6362 family protein [Roseibium sp. RKSG952]MTH96363.1 hypothetical protein [Roseibium sp. RKSG952]